MCFLGDTLNRVYDNMELTKKAATCSSKDHEGQVQRYNRSASRASNGKSRAHFTVPLTGTAPDCAVAPCRGRQWESIHPHVESHWRTISRRWCPVIRTEPQLLLCLPHLPQQLESDFGTRWSWEQPLQIRNFIPVIL